MYLILDKDVRKSLVESESVTENFNTSLLSNDDNDNDNIFDTYNENVQELDDHEQSIVSFFLIRRAYRKTRKQKDIHH
jgi:hypothetical protein